MNDLTLDYLFHPQSIAIAGVSGNPDKWNPGRGYLYALVGSGFRGKIYPVNPSGGEIDGAKIYASIKDIPGSVDYVISAIPAQHTPQLITDCAAKGVKAIHFFTSGFSEIEDEEGEHLASEILEVVRQSGIRVIGPNCMGLYCPRTGLSFALEFPGQSGFPKQSGPVGLLAQSGGNSNYCIREASAKGVYFSKVVSYGNAVDLNESDFLEYFAGDSETEVIAAYIEGVKDGSRFARALKEATKVKPVIIFKVGATETGTRAAASHTGAVAGASKVWESLLRQSGAIQVYSLEEVVDVSLAFLRVSLPEGRNTAVIGVGGGASVIAADECSNAGLTLPTLPVQLRRRLRDMYTTEAGCIFRNPVDMAPVTGKKMLADSIRAIADCDQIDLLIMHVAFDMWSLIDVNDVTAAYIETILDLKGTIDKPVAVVLHFCAVDRAKELASRAQSRLCEAGFAVYSSIGRAASAINKLIEYHEWRQGSREDA